MAENISKVKRQTANWGGGGIFVTDNTAKGSFLYYMKDALQMHKKVINDQIEKRVNSTREVHTK